MKLRLNFSLPPSLLFGICVGLCCLLPFAVAMGLSQKVYTSNSGERFEMEEVVSGLSFPWSLAFMPDGAMLVTERTGTLRRISAKGKLDPKPIEGVPKVAVVGQGGLFDVALHPQFSKNQLLYLSYAGYSADGKTYSTELLRAKLQGHRLVESQVIFRQLPKTNTGLHFGGRIAFDKKGYLYLTLGDRGEQDRAQKRDDHAGAVIRLMDDGKIPADNPWVKGPHFAEKMSFGHRNQQGAIVHPLTDEIWTHEHGPQGGDEINIVRKGVNYGWPIITYGRNYGSGTAIGEGTAKSGVAQPLHYWIPSIAPSGMAYYGGKAFPKWRSNIFVGALAGQMLVRTQWKGDKYLGEERLLTGEIGRIRDVRVGPEGYIYLLTDSDKGSMYRLRPPTP